MAAPRRKYTVEEKRALLEMYDRLPRMDQKSAARRLNVSQPFLSRLLRSRNCVLSNRSAPRVNSGVIWGETSGLESALWRWVDVSERSGTPVTVDMIRRKARELSLRMGLVDFRPSPAWSDGFRKRVAVSQGCRVCPEDTDGQNCGPRRAPPDRGDGGWTAGEKRSGTDERTEPCEHRPVKREHRVLAAQVNGGVQTIAVPSLHQMKEAMKTLATGLLYRGFCDFKLLHQFENEVANIIKTSVDRGESAQFCSPTGRCAKTLDEDAS
ncbi:uncharacterized protein LOC143509209 [Brachyhypopomus gauderio]|uniref:uncharacterized protein LOC143509209 n=1 Tax=Brachyhypopomus gauderio TaxID=698409 RepID=UPI004041F67B